MQDKKKDKEFLKGKKFFEGIKFWQKQIAELVNLKSKLKHSQAELKKFPQKLHSQVEIRTFAERMVIKQLHQEIEHRKKAEQKAQDARIYAENIVDTVREPLLVLDADLKVISASRSFYQSFKVKPEDTEKQHIFDLGNRQWDIPKLRELLENILPNTTSFEGFEVVHVFPDIGKRIMLLNARKIYQKSNNTQLILLAMEDVTEHKRLEEKLKTLASYDDLTGCINFRLIMELLEKEIHRSLRHQKQFIVVMIDIDDFKSMNDEYGHQAGNDILVAFAGVIKKSLRAIDSVGRYGGDEFIIILPETDVQHVLVVLGRIKESFEKTKITSMHLAEGTDVAVKFSAGIAAFPHNAKDLKGLIRAADNALLQAKREGKNTVVLEKRIDTPIPPNPNYL
ncbi:MAG: sensor domain-containing diguanylate cyclase [Candidatus Omnitrophica bacterium]|nr:sensor domain-containing diguanylate cyclase [Candidatus Omnitrophota bacterium]